MPWAQNSPPPTPHVASSSSTTCASSPRRSAPHNPASAPSSSPAPTARAPRPPPSPISSPPPALRTALYTSPHLTRVTERIRTNTAPAASQTLVPYSPTPTLHEIPEETFARLFFQVDEAARQLVAAGTLPHRPSYFETLTALAFLYFAEQKIELAVLEVGLGGRLDATNIVDPLLSILTDISLDHQDYLGNTITAIAREKAGILRPHGTLITLPQHPEANQAIGEAAVSLEVRAINAADHLPGRDFTSSQEPASTAPKPAVAAVSVSRTHLPSGSSQTEQSEFKVEAPPIPANPACALPRNTYTLTLDSAPLHVPSPLLGQHQQRNIALAIAAAAELRHTHGYTIPNSAIEAGIANTAWPGRLEFLPPNLLLDVAHNPAGAWTLRAALAHSPNPSPAPSSSPASATRTSARSPRSSSLSSTPPPVRPARRAAATAPHHPHPHRQPPRRLPRRPRSPPPPPSTSPPTPPPPPPKPSLSPAPSPRPTASSSPPAPSTSWDRSAPLRPLPEPAGGTLHSHGAPASVSFRPLLDCRVDHLDPLRHSSSLDGDQFEVKVAVCFFVNRLKTQRVLERNPAGLGGCNKSEVPDKKDAVLEDRFVANAF